ncbi:Ubiquitin carboxyl-terminal hydrolase [Handroanthus impetiginosus]|uniref:Ubiquitin carboxyl-terminal hydrolase n=1 Tax=Handroanthus impetiginosus TaxID=429701 RepID=A0A2G9I743_9LAMI|nr:Ubiquitin carboxyl-terminal hydrolase [Handroanthus impetiginosus]
MGSPDSSHLSPWDDQKSPELYDAALLLEEETEDKGPEIEDHDELLNSPRQTALSSGLSSHWTQPWPGSTDCCENSSESQLALDNGSPNGTAWKSAGVQTNRSPSNWLFPNRQPLRVGVGLANLGNTCFMNSVLQCFTHTVPLLHGVLSDKHLAHSDCEKEGFCILCALRELAFYSVTSVNLVISPYKLVENLSYFSSDFQKYQQEDAHEFLQCFLDKLESCHNSKHRGCTCSQSDNIVKRVFGGRLVSKLKCCNCNHCSDTYEPSIDLSLEIKDASDLLTSLKSFTKVEKIEDQETRYTCENCKEQVSIEKQLSFDQAPSVAAFHLKRFEADGSLVQKIDKHVAFPLDLDLLPFTSTGKINEAELKYVLYAIVVHDGLTLSSGHYYSFIRLCPNLWCKFDDSKVMLVCEEYVLSQEAYILFYAKEGTPWYSAFSENFSIAPTMWSTSPKSVLDNADTPVSHGLQQKIICDSIEARHDIGSEHGGVNNNEIKDSRPMHGTTKSNESRDNLPSMSTSVAPFPSDSSDACLSEAQKEVSSSLLEKVNQSQEVHVVANCQNDAPQTPPRSPSPEIYREDPPDAGFSIPRDHVRLIDRISCKRRLEKDMDDLETRQASSFIKKSMPGSRGQQLLAALRGSKTEGSVNRKKSRTNRNDSSGANSGIGSRLHRSLVAGTYRHRFDAEWMATFVP